MMSLDELKAKYPEKIIDGKAFAENLTAKLAAKVQWLKNKHNLTPGLAVILVSDNPASIIYVRNKGKKTQEIGMNSFEFNLPLDTSQKNLIKKIESLNNDPKIHGILVQLPLPKHIDEKAIINAISPLKDVDGFHVENVGKLYTDQDGFVPCTPLGCQMMLKDRLKDLTGKKAVIIGRSNIVGKPMAQLLLKENCTVTIVHSKTPNIEEECRQADILVAAVGKPEMVKASWVKEGAVIVDVGINRVQLPDNRTKLVGDVDFADCIEKASAITPVPGGVGPMTIACLLYNTFKAACKSRNIEMPEV